MQYPIVMFDWGDTIMKDDPAMDTPMVLWPRVEAVEGAEELLQAIHARRTVVMATSANQSNEAEIRLALQRVHLNEAFDRIFCFKNTGRRKSSKDFYPFILEALGAKPSEVLMVGDHFESDVLGAAKAGLSSVWFNPKDGQERTGERYQTIHALRDLLRMLD
jgi:HAD superfamily hydrolase (TIGR01509 family)